MLQPPLRHWAAQWMLAILLTSLLGACGLPGDGSSPGVIAPRLAHSTPTLTPFQPWPPTAVPATPEPSTTPTLEPSPTTSPLSIWIDPQLPAELRSALQVPGEFSQVDQPSQAALRLQVSNERAISRWVYALVAPFPTLEQAVSLIELQAAWSGQAYGSMAGHRLIMDDSTYATFTIAWGPAGSQTVGVLPADELLGYAWDHRSAWALLPFERLEPRWKVLEVDGVSPLHKTFDLTSYSLALPVSLIGDPTLADAVLGLYGSDRAAPLAPASNRDPNRLTTVALTGVTALVRATAYTMEQRGVAYPGRDVRDWLREADITHISNEVPFAKNCPFPNPTQPDMRFCSDQGYIALLEDVGTDIVELTGDHFQDWGQEAMHLTLDMYQQRGWLYYGGGANLEEGRKAAIIEHNGNRIAFIGCNGKGGGYAQAGPNRPGAVVCDYVWLQSEITRLAQAGYLPIVTYQHFEYYNYRAQPSQQRDFRRAAEAGAVIVSGSQAHQPQALEFFGETLIHYGLGNLFFDQFDVSYACRQAFIDRHIFYNGRYIGAELLPILFVDYARPRPMTPSEREDLLRVVFRASGW